MACHSLYLRVSIGDVFTTGHDQHEPDNPIAMFVRQLDGSHHQKKVKKMIVKKAVMMIGNGVERQGPETNCLESSLGK